jgi:SAM-dependent methyltransferase
MKLSDLNPFDKIRRLIAYNRDRAFENKYGIRTSEKSQIIYRESLQTDSLNRQHATAYQGVWFDIIEMLALEAKKNSINLADLTFLDVGSGMGKACFCAHELGFKNIRGFDFDSSLVQKAKDNLEIIKNKMNIDVDFFVADAAEFVAQVEPTFLFFYHPFDHIVMTKFLNNNIGLFESPVVIGYSNDQFRYLLKDMGLKMLFRNEKRRTSLWCNF